jgi:hypothetical protein
VALFLTKFSFVFSGSRHLLHSGTDCVSGDELTMRLRIWVFSVQILAGIRFHFKIRPERIKDRDCTALQKARRCPPQV